MEAELYETDEGDHATAASLAANKAMLAEYGIDESMLVGPPTSEADEKEADALLASFMAEEAASGSGRGGRHWGHRQLPLVQW